MQITIVYFGVKGTSAVAAKNNCPMLQIGTGTGGTPTATGYTGAVVTTGGTAGSTAQTAISNFTTGFATACGLLNNTGTYQGHITLTRLNAGANVWLVSGTSSFNNSTTATIIAVSTFSGSVNLVSSELSSITLTTIGGTDMFTAGTLNVYETAPA